MPETLTQADNFWLNMDDPTNLMVITGFWEFKEPLDFNRLYATVDARLASFPRFKKKIVRPKTGLGLPKWVWDKHYDLSSHLHRIALPDPGDKQELQKLVSTLKTTALDPNKPLWDIHLIENYGEGCVLFFRLHHCIADGIALMHVLHASADTEEDAPWPKAEENGKKTHVCRSPVSSMNFMMTSARDAWKKGQDIAGKIKKEVENMSAHQSSLKFMLKIGANLPSDIATVISRHLLMSADPNTAFKGHLGVPKKTVWTDPIPLDRIKHLGKAIDSATLNDVLIATVTGSMRRYLKTRNTRVNELDLKVMVPVNIRKPGTEFELGNKFSLVFLKLPIHLKDPVLRLKEVKRRMDKLKTSADPYVNFGFLSAIGFFPTVVAKGVVKIFGNKASGVLTNVPGPRKPLYFAGKEISNIMFWVPRSGVIGLGISIFSYNGTVTIGVASDKGRMPDPEVLLEGFEEEFNYLLDIVQSGKINEGPLVLHDRFAERSKADNSKGTKGKKGSAVTDESPRQCQAYTKAGKRCLNKAVEGSEFCTLHKQYEKEGARLEDVAQIMRDLAK